MFKFRTSLNSDVSSSTESTPNCTPRTVIVNELDFDSLDISPRKNEDDHAMKNIENPIRRQSNVS